MYWTRLFSCPVKRLSFCPLVLQFVLKSPSETASLKVTDCSDMLLHLTKSLFWCERCRSQYLWALCVCVPAQGSTWWKRSVWLRELTPQWRGWPSSLLSSTPSSPTLCTETSSWPRAPGETSSSSSSSFVFKDIFYNNVSGIWVRGAI